MFTPIDSELIKELSPKYANVSTYIIELYYYIVQSDSKLEEEFLKAFFKFLHQDSDFQKI